MREPPIFDRMVALADPVRSRVLLVLERHELSVGELCAVFQLPQSSMSRQLKVLTDEGWLAARAERTSRRYRMAPERLEEGSRELWAVVRGSIESLPEVGQDAQRVRGVLAERRSNSRNFFSSKAGDWDRLRADLYGERLGVISLMALLNGDWTVGDLGCGTGQMSALLAPFVERVIAVDDSPEMLEAARERLQAYDNAELRAGALESLPLADGELDAAVLSLVLHYVAEPREALREVARVMRPDGRVLIVDMEPHQREEYRLDMGHLWQGFSEERMSGWLREAGLTATRRVSLPTDPEARGPSLFAQVATRAGDGSGGTASNGSRRNSLQRSRG